RRLAQGYTLMLPELLHELGTTDPYQLRALQIGSFGQQDVRHMVCFIEGVGECDDEPHVRHRLDEPAALPERDGRVAAEHEPDIGRGRPLPMRWRLPQEHPSEVSGAQRLSPR